MPERMGGTSCALATRRALLAGPAALAAHKQQRARTAPAAAHAMAWRSHGDSNSALVDALSANGLVKSARVASAMKTVDRGAFIPPDAGPPYWDQPLPIGYSQTISAPHMHATALEILEHNLRPGAKVLDVGSGSGYLTACFAMLVAGGDDTADGTVVGIDVVEPLVKRSVTDTKKASRALRRMVENGTLKLLVGDGWSGYAPLAPYDAIHVGAAAETVPKALLEQLKPGGTLVIPVGAEHGYQTLERFDKDAQGRVTKVDLFGVRYVPLVRE